MRAALGELGAEERADLLDDLESHLAEVAGESDAPLVERLGPPETYAAELRAAYRPAPGERRQRARVRISRRWRLATIAVLVAAGIGAWAAWQLTARDAKSEAWSYAQLVDRAQAGQVRQVDVAGRQVVATDRAGRRHDVVDAPMNQTLAVTLTANDVDVAYQQPSAIQPWLVVLLPNAILLALMAAIGALMYIAIRRARARPSRA